jgi:hypothetical protein
LSDVLANQRMQRTHSRVTALAEERKRRATRRAADAQRYAHRVVDLTAAYDVVTM